MLKLLILVGLLVPSFESFAGPYYVPPGTEVDGSFHNENSWHILNKAVEGLMVRIRSRDLVKTLDRPLATLDGYIDDVVDEDVIPVFDETSNHKQFLKWFFTQSRVKVAFEIIPTAEGYEQVLKRCYRKDKRGLFNELLFDFDPETYTVYACKLYFVAYNNFEGETAFENAVWRTQRYILQDISHLPAIGYSTSDKVYSSNDWAMEILCTRKDKNKECLQKVRNTSLSFSYESAPPITRNLPSGHNLSQNWSIDDGMLFNNRLWGVVIDALIGWEDSTQYETSLLSDIYREPKSNKIESFYNMSFDSLRVDLSVDGEGQEQCWLHSYISIRDSHQPMVMVDRAHGKAEATAASCKSGLISSRAVQLALNDSALGLTPLLNNRSKELFLNVSPQISGVKMIDRAGVKKLRVVGGSDELNSQLRRAWSQWKPSYGSVIWRYTRGFTSTADRESYPENYFNIEITDIEYQREHDKRRVSVSYLTTDKVGREKEGKVIFSEPIRFSGSTKSEAIVHAIISKLEKTVEEVSIFATDTNEACHFALSPDGQQFLNTHIDELDFAELSDYLAGLQSGERTQLQMKVAGKCHTPIRDLNLRLRRQKRQTRLRTATKSENPLNGHGY